jgi:hypothetical protein
MSLESQLSNEKLKTKCNRKVTLLKFLRVFLNSCLLSKTQIVQKYNFSLILFRFETLYKAGRTQFKAAGKEALRKIFEPKKEKATRGLIKLLNKDLHIIYLQPQIRIIRSLSVKPWDMNTGEKREINE